MNFPPSAFTRSCEEKNDFIPPKTIVKFLTHSQ